MIEISTIDLGKGEKLINVKATSKRKAHRRKVKTAAEADAEMDAKLAALRIYTTAATLTNQWIKDNPDRYEDVGEVNDYTVDHYHEINHYLGKNKLISPEQRMLDVDEIVEKSTRISNFLQDAPKFNGIAYRGKYMRIETDSGLEKYNTFMKNINNSDTIILKSFSSSTADKNIAKNYIRGGANKGNIMFSIRSKSGVALGKSAAFHLEREVLFNKNTEFKIINVNTSSEGTSIELEEI